MKYRAVALDQDRYFVLGDTLEKDFIIQDENGIILTDLSDWTFEATIYSPGNSIECNGSGYFSTSGAKLTLIVGTLETTDLIKNTKYILELQGILDNKIYTLLQKEIWFRQEYIV